MSRLGLVRVAASLALLAGAKTGFPQNPPGPPQKTLQKVKDDLYVIDGRGGNVAIYLTNDGVILVDDKFERDYNDIMAKVKSLTDQPVKYVLNTQHQRDHTGGNEKLLITAEVIAHKNARANMLADRMPGLPRLAFADEFEVYLGGKEVFMYHYGRGHTNGDAVVYFPALRVLHTGDLFTVFPDYPPVIDYADGGSAIEWTKTLDEILKLDFDVVIPGHGPISKKEDIVKYKLMIESMRNRVRIMNHEHKSKEEIAKMLATEYHWQDFHMKRALDGLIAEMK
jgi:cyclase